MGDRKRKEEDRRRDPRYDRSFLLRVGHDSEDGLKAESINISTRGLYCKVPRYVHPFSKLRVALELPFVSRTPEKIECEGVVVRVEPNAEEAGIRDYRLAIYFLNLDKTAAHLISDFIAEGH